MENPLRERVTGSLIETMNTAPAVGQEHLISLSKYPLGGRPFAEPAEAAASAIIRQQTAVIKAIRAHLAEFGIVAPVGLGFTEPELG